MNKATFSIRTPTSSTLALSEAVLIYKSRSGGVLATRHPIEDVDGEPVIGAGTAVTLRATRDMARALGRPIGIGGFLPDSVLYADGETLLWWLSNACLRIQRPAPLRSRQMRRPSTVRSISPIQMLIGPSGSQEKRSTTRLSSRMKPS